MNYLGQIQQSSVQTNDIVIHIKEFEIKGRINIAPPSDMKYSVNIRNSTVWYYMSITKQDQTEDELDSAGKMRCLSEYPQTVDKDITLFISSSLIVHNIQ